MENEISLSNSGLAISNHDVFSQIGYNCRMEARMERISSEHKHGRRFIVLEHQYGRCDVM